MTLYAPQIRIHDVLERGKTVTLSLPIYRDGALVPPSSGTFELQDSAGTTVVAEAAVGIAANIASYTILAASLPNTLDLSDNYLEIWKIVIAGETYTFRKPAAIARSSIFPVISDLDLEAQYSDLSSVRPSSMTSFQSYIDEAWYQLISRLRNEGNLEYLIIDSQSLRMPHIDLTCYLIFKDFDSSGLGEGRYMDLAKEHRVNFADGFGRLNFRYDVDQTGTMGSNPENRRAARSVIYTSAPPNYWRRRVW